MEWKQWFVEGVAFAADALTATGLQDLLGTGREFYACPCCLTACDRDEPLPVVISTLAVPMS